MHAKSKGWDGEEKRRGRTNPGEEGRRLKFQVIITLGVCCRRAFLSQCEARETLQILTFRHSTLGGRLTSAAADEEERERGREREGDRGEDERQRAETSRETISENPLTDAARKVNIKKYSNKKQRQRKRGKKQQRSSQLEGEEEEVGGGGEGWVGGVFVRDRFGETDGGEG